jgi:hypothetical protein
MVGRAWWLVFGLFVVGCGGGASTAGDAEAPEETSLSEETSSESPGVAEEEAEPAAPAAQEALSEDDIADVLEQVLEDPDLDRYLHLDVPGRLPLKLSGEGIPAKLKIIKGSYEVKVVDGPASAKDPVLVFTRIERDGDSVRVRYRYDVEGISGSAVVFKKDGAWRLGANRVIEK